MITITEALAEIPTIEKRIIKKQDFIKSCLYRPATVRDQFEADGGATKLIYREMQSIHDLQERLVKIRAAISKANSENTITVEDQTRTIADWLTWRREISAKEQRFIMELLGQINNMRRQATMKGLPVTTTDTGYSEQMVVNMDERMLAADVEQLEIVLGALDGQLSLKNATITLDLDTKTIDL